MDRDVASSDQEVRRLRACLNDLVSVLALPALWMGGERSQVSETLLSVVVRLLHLDFAFIELDAAEEEPMLRMLGTPDKRSTDADAAALGDRLRQFVSRRDSSARFVLPEAGQPGLFAFHLRIGLMNDFGWIVAASTRESFPTETEQLLLGVAMNQALIGLQEARLRSDQRRVTTRLDCEVAIRTAQLKAANDELKDEIQRRDIAERRWRRSELFLMEAEKLSLTGSFSWDHSTGEMYWSDEAYRIWELDRESLPTIDYMRQCLHPEDEPRFIELVGEQSSVGIDQELEFQLNLRAGRTKWIQILCRTVRDGAERPFRTVGAIRDITKRKKAEEALQSAQAELARVVRVASMAEFTAAIAHELNQPLAAIVANGSACLRWLAASPPNTPEAEQNAHGVIRDGRRAGEIIARLRALFRQTGSISARVDLNEIIRNVLPLVLSELSIRNINARLELLPQLPPVLGDPVQLQQLVFNLISNAMDAMMTEAVDGPRELLVSTKIHASGGVVGRVKDSGIGIQTGITSKVFETFYTTKQNGIGMGLPICKTIVERHGGEIGFEANDGPGVTFFFTLPAASRFSLERGNGGVSGES